jgi:DNA-binding winged helix-turn-helix (wHTH) protein
MDPASEPPASVAFRRFRVLPHRSQLRADGRPIKFGGRASDVPMALIEACEAVIGKDALMARVWSDRIVEENNLQAQISALLAAFGAERKLIRTVPGRGPCGSRRFVLSPGSGSAPSSRCVFRIRPNTRPRTFGAGSWP